jgi:hypothetical protein
MRALILALGLFSSCAPTFIPEDPTYNAQMVAYVRGCNTGVLLKCGKYSCLPWEVMEMMRACEQQGYQYYRNVKENG